MSLTTPHLFEDPDWEIFHTIGWIRDRSKDQFGAMNDLHDFRAAVFYGPPELNPWKAAKTLFRELRVGRIRAVKDRQLLDPRYWVSDKLLATTLGVYQRCAGVYVPSAPVLDLWPHKDTCQRRLIIALSARVHKLLPVQALVAQPQTDPTEAAQSAIEATKQAASNPAPDASPAAKKRRSRMKPKHDTILEGLLAVYPDGYHQSITPSIAKNTVTPWLEKNHPGFVPTQSGLSIDTVRRALQQFKIQTKDA